MLYALGCASSALRLLQSAFILPDMVFSWRCYVYSWCIQLKPAPPVLLSCSTKKKVDSIQPQPSVFVTKTTTPAWISRFYDLRSSCFNAQTDNSGGFSPRRRLLSSPCKGKGNLVLCYSSRTSIEIAFAWSFSPFSILKTHSPDSLKQISSIPPWANWIPISFCIE